MEDASKSRPTDAEGSPLVLVTTTLIHQTTLRDRIGVLLSPKEHHEMGSSVMMHPTHEYRFIAPLKYVAVIGRQRPTINVC